MPQNNIPGSHHLRAKGNLSYNGFIRLVEKLWYDQIGLREDGVTPRVPFHASYNPVPDPIYPCIVYELQLRRPFQGEPKPKTRETIYGDDGTPYVVRAQRFQNIVQFSVMDRVQYAGTHNAEDILNLFEDFMFENTAIFKELGLSDIFYARRIADSELQRTTMDVIKHTVAYEVITEKVIVTDVWKFNEILINARVWAERNELPDPATPDFSGISWKIDDQFSAATPYFA